MQNKFEAAKNTSKVNCSNNWQFNGDGKKVHFLRISGSSVPCGIRCSKIYCKVKGCQFVPVKDMKVYPGMELQLKSLFICI